MLMLDADVLIDYQRGHMAAHAWFTGLAELPHLPGFVAMEILQNARNKSELAKSQQLLSALPIIWPSVLDCEKAYADFASFHLSHSLGLLDSLIGATAVGQNATLCTFNQKHFAVIPNLLTLKLYIK